MTAISIVYPNFAKALKRLIKAKHVDPDWK
jgi:hypothetical protein